MLKKLLILPILWSILWLGAFASADTVDGFTSDNDISVINIVDDSAIRMEEITEVKTDLNTNNPNFYVCISTDTVPYYLNWDWNSEFITLVSNKNYCSNFEYHYWDYWLSFYSDSEMESSVDFNWKLYVSSSPITYSSSSDSSDSSLGIPEIPASFTSGLTSLVNNFGGTIANWLPTIILVALGIYAIFALFRVVRNYARSSFRG